MRILYLGLPLGALRLAAAGHDLVVVGLGHPQEPGARRVRRQLGLNGGSQAALVLGRPDLDRSSVLELLASARPDVLLSWFWPTRIPGPVLALVAGRAYGVHPSLLPRWRGPDPYFWALRSGDTQTGVSLHQITSTYDTGVVVERRSVQIEPHCNAWQLARQLDRPGLELLLECADRLLETASLRTLEGLAGSVQDERLATWAPVPSAQDLALRFELPTQQLLDLVRAAAPNPGATAQLDEDLVQVLAAEVWSGDMPSALRVSEAWRTSAGFAVRTGDGALLLRRIRLEDGRILEGTSISERYAARE